MQLIELTNNIKVEDDRVGFNEYFDKRIKKHAINLIKTNSLLPGMDKQLLLSLPASSAEVERSFNKLKKLLALTTGSKKKILTCIFLSSLISQLNKRNNYLCLFLYLTT